MLADSAQKAAQEIIRPGRGRVRAGTAAGQATSAHTVRPRESPRTPQLWARAWTMISPRPQSLIGSSLGRGAPGPP